MKNKAGSTTFWAVKKNGILAGNSPFTGRGDGSSGNIKILIEGFLNEDKIRASQKCARWYVKWQCTRRNRGRIPKLSKKRGTNDHLGSLVFFHQGLFCDRIEQNEAIFEGNGNKLAIASQGGNRKRVVNFDGAEERVIRVYVEGRKVLLCSSDEELAINEMMHDRIGFDRGNNREGAIDR
jgi:hypothetical protein